MTFPQNEEAENNNRPSARCGKHAEHKTVIRNLRKPHFLQKHDSA